MRSEKFIPKVELKEYQLDQLFDSNKGEASTHISEAIKHLLNQ